MRARRRRLRRLLRQAVPQVRAAARDLSRVRAARLQVVPHGDAVWLKEKLFQKSLLRDQQELRKLAPDCDNASCLFTEHHRVARGERPSIPRRSNEAAVLTMDGVGEWSTTSLGRRRRQRAQDAARSSTFRTRSACSTPRSPTTPGSR